MFKLLSKKYNNKPINKVSKCNLFKLLTFLNLTYNYNKLSNAMTFQQIVLIIKNLVFNSLLGNLIITTLKFNYTLLYIIKKIKISRLRSLSP